MVVASPNPPVTVEKLRDDIHLPTMDLKLSDRSELSAGIVKACKEFGFFKVINHGVPPEIISGMEGEAHRFFSRPGSEKQRAGPSNPYGYGSRNIGLNGDTGEVEYLLLQANPNSIASLSTNLSNRFSGAAIGYAEAVRELACELLDLMEQGLGAPESESESESESFMSGLIRDVQNDSILRMNHYPPSDRVSKIGFGEHTDPQMLTILRSNGVEGLQISLQDGVWIPVPVDPSAFCVNVGDVMQVMTNGKFKSVRHRAVVSSYKSRMSVAYFAAPPLHATISRLAGLSTMPYEQPVYRSFTWAEYKKATYMCRLGDSRLNLFKRIMPDDQTSERE